MHWLASQLLGQMLILVFGFKFKNSLLKIRFWRFSPTLLSEHLWLHILHLTLWISWISFVQCVVLPLNIKYHFLKKLNFLYWITFLFCKPIETIGLSPILGFLFCSIHECICPFTIITLFTVVFLNPVLLTNIIIKCCLLPSGCSYFSYVLNVMGCFTHCLPFSKLKSVLSSHGLGRRNGQGSYSFHFLIESGTLVLHI